MRVILALLAACTLLPVHSVAQSAAALDSVDRYLRSELERQRIPGMSIALLRGDSILLARGYGFANLEHRVPATDSTIYQSGSVGKQFTSAAVVTLAREGRLRLDDPIRKFLPAAPASWSGVTIRHLLTHTSGIPDYTSDLVDFRRDYTEEALARLYARLPLDFKPGSTWSYSNTGYALLGFIVHRVTGQFYGDYLKERVFGPLGMRTARVISERDIVPNRAAGYELVDGEIENQGWVSPSLNTTADGALYLTVQDLARWAIGLNHARIPDSAGLAASWTPVRLNDGGTYPYGFGWRVDDQRGHPRIGHGGSWQGFRASIQRYPEYDLTVIALANLDAAMPEVVTTTIAGIMEPALLPPHLLPPGADGPPEPIERLVADLAAGKARPRLAAGLRSFASRSVREEWGRSIAKVSRWESLGCDAVGDRGISRLGTSIERICYARALGSDSRLLVSVGYGKDWQAAELDSYEY
ncbi:MAG TPA: serine hydrolase domain-containing protein [Gemmatimonadales bacterium]|nr:serine hydrolase domain-containing protein [Gemmatimonadales bacterium]